ncbi:DUF3601 domain-containing protein [Microbulbifer sp. 2205BS26-8]|uniref:DUF3601 domain-containing protein n=1 Tax=Microbulbifer sp. 2205BS26-8 TaxID=3064386 RepID=UPI00273D77E9|nr:DUF3601 domain-containing protein [Microbulbifer sp. 2205BS26-8]MDP5208856.1 DUF3601 domain-containing protein [Microbulbifer sp. 2205BS26-8]
MPGDIKRDDHYTKVKCQSMNKKNLNKKYGHLKAGLSYRIAKSFRDYDHNVYDEGKVLKFCGSSFLPYDAGLSLFCLLNNQETQIRLQVLPEEQEEIAHNLDQYLVPVGE